MFKILFLIPNLSHGGAEHVLVNLVNNLNHDRYDITVKTLFNEGIYKQNLINEIKYEYCFKKHFRGNSSLFSIIPSKVLYKWLIGKKYDIVISFLEGPTAHIISGCPFSETKKVYWIHTAFTEKNHFKVGFCTFKSALETYKSADRLVCVADTVRKRMEYLSGCNLKNSIILYNTNETEKIKELSKEPITDINFDNKIINVCSTGKIIEVKGYDRLIKVHKRLINEGYKHHIYILGVGELQRQLERLLKENHLNDTFTFLGFRTNPYKYLSKCDLFVCSSRREGFSTAVTESLIVGTPVVSTNVSGARELLGDNNEYGIVTENTDEGIYQGMKKILEDKDLRQYYSEKALERGKKFSKEETIMAVEKMFEELLI